MRYRIREIATAWRMYGSLVGKQAKVVGVASLYAGAVAMAHVLELVAIAAGVVGIVAGVVGLEYIGRM
jgi:hypothetical protein